MSIARPIILVLDDDEDLSAILVRTLHNHGYAAEAVGRVRAMERRLEQIKPALCIIDVCLPDGESLDVIMRRLRRDAVPAIVISGRWTEVSDRIHGLEAGADDYMLKPFDPRELVARVGAVLRRSSDRTATEGEVARFAGWTADFRAHHLISPEGEEIELSSAEARLLRMLLTRPRRVQSREMLIEGADAARIAFDRSIDVRISRLRTKLRENPTNPRIIKTIYGAGYLLAATVEWPKATDGPRGSESESEADGPPS